MNQSELELLVAELTQNIDDIGDELVAKIESYQLRYENLLLKQKFELDKGKLVKSTTNFNKAQSLNAMERLGFQDIAVAHIKTYDDIAAAQLIYNGRLGLEADINFRDLEVLKRLKEVDLGGMLLEGDGLDAMVKKQLVNAVALGSDWSDTVDNLSAELLGSGDTMGSLARYAETYMRTALFGLSRIVDKEVYDKVGAKKFLYVGPLDAHTREFCVEHVGKEYTEEEISNFPDENGSDLDPWFAPGGYNCRHRLVPVDVLD